MSIYPLVYTPGHLTPEAEVGMRIRNGLLSVWLTTIPIVGGCHKSSISVPRLPSAIQKGGGYTDDQYRADLKAYLDNLNGANDPETARSLRNKIVYGLMAQIDKEFGELTWRFYYGKADIALAGDSAVLGLTAASTIATHTPTKTILSALGTAVTGVNLSVDKNFFAQQTYQTLAVAMQNRRDKARTAIERHVRCGDPEDYCDDAEDYPLEAAKRDLVAYFYAGSLMGGLQELQEEASAAAKEQAAHPAATIH